MGLRAANVRPGCLPMRMQKALASPEWRSVAIPILLGIALAACLVRADPPPPPGSSTATPPDASSRADPKDRCFREGTVVTGQGGTFRRTGERLAFFPSDGTGRLVCLENRNLERIARAIEETPGRLLWSVSGTLTEYRGVNFLMVECAILTADRPTSEAAADSAS